MESASQPQALEAARQFVSSQADIDVREIGSGNINDTFLVSSSEKSPFILQRLSSEAFASPELICKNLQVLNSSLPSDTIARLVSDGRWEIPLLLKSIQGDTFWTDSSGHIWRALSYIDKSLTLDSVDSQKQALEVGRALAIFHNLVSPITPDSLQVTIPHFHDTPRYFKLYKEALATYPACDGNDLFNHCCAFIDEHEAFITLLEDSLAAGELKVTTTHGDPKLANILFDKDSGKACAFIDLDTVGPGLLLTDIADCLRSCCNPGGGTYDLATTRFDSTICLAIMEGYLEHGRHLLTEGDKKHLLTAIRLIPFELGLRFFTDYLQGCHYFKTSSPQQTLQRAAAQFRLVSSIEAQSQSLESQLAPLLYG